MDSTEMESKVSIKSVRAPPANLEAWLQPTRILNMVFCLVKFITSGGNSTGEGCFKLGTKGNELLNSNSQQSQPAGLLVKDVGLFDVWDDHFQKFWAAPSNPTKKWVFFSLAEGLGSSQAFTALLDNSKERAVQIMGGRTYSRG